MVSRQNQLEAFADDLKRLAGVLQTQDKDVASKLKSAAEGLKKPVAKRGGGRNLQDAKEQIELIKFLGRTNGGPGEPRGWQRLKINDPKLHKRAVESGLNYGVFKNRKTGRVVVAFYGNQGSIQDLETVGRHALGEKNTAQDAAGKDIVGRAKELYGGKANVSVTGHSMGGAVAAIAADKHDVNAILFNSQGMNGFSYASGQQVHHYYVNGDFATAIQGATGLPDAPGVSHQLQPKVGDPINGDQTPWGAHHEGAVSRALR